MSAASMKRPSTAGDCTCERRDTQMDQGDRRRAAHLAAWSSSSTAGTAEYTTMRRPPRPLPAPPRLLPPGRRSRPRTPRTTTKKTPRRTRCPMTAEEPNEDGHRAHGRPELPRGPVPGLERHPRPGQGREARPRQGRAAAGTRSEDSKGIEGWVSAKPRTTRRCSRTVDAHHRSSRRVLAPATGAHRHHRGPRLRVARRHPLPRATGASSRGDRDVPRRGGAARRLRRPLSALRASASGKRPRRSSPARTRISREMTKTQFEDAYLAGGDRSLRAAPSRSLASDRPDRRSSRVPDVSAPLAGRSARISQT